MPEFADYQKHLFQKKTIDGVAKLVRTSGVASDSSGNLAVDVPIDEVDEAILNQLGENQFITAPIIGGDAGNADITVYASKQFVMDYSLKKANSAIIYIDPSSINASDTLDDGRGDTEDKPFLNFIPALHYAFNKYSGYVYLYVMSDCIVPDGININAARGRIIIKGKTKDTKITFSNTFTITGCVRLHEIVVEFGQDKYVGVWGTDEFSSLMIDNDVSLILNNSYVFISGPGAYCYLGSTGINISGTSHNAYGVFMVSNGSALDLHACTAISGSVTGKRYHCTNQGRIILAGKGNEFIPGTIAGTCDSSSVVA